MFGLQIVGCPDALRGKYKRVIDRDIDYLSKFQNQLTDKALLNAVRSFKEHLNSFDETSEKFSHIIKSDKKQRPVTSTESMDDLPPEWIDRPPYSELLIISSKKMLMIIDDVEGIIRRISQLRTNLEMDPTSQNEKGVAQKLSALRKLIKKGIKNGYIKALGTNGY